MVIEGMELDAFASFQEQVPGAPDWAFFLFKMFDSRLERIEAKCDISKETSNDAKAISKEVREYVEELEAKIDQLEYQQQKQEDYNRRSNLKIEGLPEPKGEGVETPAKLMQTVHDFIKNNLKIDTDIRFERCHRLGPKGKSSRPVIVRFNWYQDRELVWGKRSLLRGSRFILREDFSARTEKARRSLYPFAKAARDQHVRYSLQGDVLYLEGKKYTCDNKDEIPAKFSPRNNATRTDDKTVIFYGRNSPFSNFYPSKFNVASVEYAHNEMYYQLKKAEHFGDDETAKRILRSQDPYDCYRAGCRVKGFDLAEWEKVESDVMLHGAQAKFQQNQDLRKMLLDTDTKELAESCKDETWGTGIPLGAGGAFDKKSWTGQNKLGVVLMLVRDRVR